MQPPPLPTPPPPTKSKPLRRGWLQWFFAIPGLLLLLLGLALIFDFTSQQTHAERGVEQSLGILVLIISAFFLAAAFIARLLRPYYCPACQTKLHRRALSCSNCHSEFV